MTEPLDSIRALVQAAEQSAEPISAVVLRRQAAELECSEETLYHEMLRNYQVMQRSVADGSKPGVQSASGLTGGEAARMQAYCGAGRTLGGPMFAALLQRALAVSCCNAAMGCIVAAPTAGSCGILPAVVLTAAEFHGYAEKDCVMSLFTAAAVGMVVARTASIAGATGGCQAECGSASAMAAAALVELAGGTPAQCADAVALSLKSQLGLVCDPVAGLVEIPCIKRNATGAVNALACAELALAGVGSAIPADETIAAMKQVGNMMSPALKETAQAGLAATPTALRLARQVHGRRGDAEESGD